MRTTRHRGQKNRVRRGRRFTLVYERLTVDGHRAIAKVEKVGGGLERRGEEPNRFAIVSSGRKFYRTDAKIEGDALGEDSQLDSAVASTQPILGCPIKRPYCGTVAGVPGTHAFDGTVLESRQLIPILGMTRGCRLWAF